MSAGEKSAPAIGRLIAGWLVFALMAAAPATAGNGAAASLAAWLFDHYVEQQIDIATRRVETSNPPLAQGIAKARAVIAQALNRHRDAFEASIAAAIEASVRADDIAELETSLRALSAGGQAPLSEAQRQRLAAMETAFRQNSQAVIRAVAVDIETLVAEIGHSAAAP